MYHFIKTAAITTFNPDNYIITKLNSIREKAEFVFKFGNTKILNQNIMIEKNYDPDNDNCPEKDTVEHLFKSKIDSDKDSLMVEESAHENSNQISKGKHDFKHIENSSDRKD